MSTTVMSHIQHETRIVIPSASKTPREDCTRWPLYTENRKKRITAKNEIPMIRPISGCLLMSTLTFVATVFLWNWIVLPADGDMGSVAVMTRRALQSSMYGQRGSYDHDVQMEEGPKEEDDGNALAVILVLVLVGFSGVMFVVLFGRYMGSALENQKRTSNEASQEQLKKERTKLQEKRPGGGPTSNGASNGHTAAQPKTKKNIGARITLQGLHDTRWHGSFVALHNVHREHATRSQAQRREGHQAGNTEYDVAYHFMIDPRPGTRNNVYGSGEDSEEGPFELTGYLDDLTGRIIWEER